MKFLAYLSDHYIFIIFFFVRKKREIHNIIVLIGYWNSSLILSNIRDYYRVSDFIYIGRKTTDMIRFIHDFPYSNPNLLHNIIRFETKVHASP